MRTATLLRTGAVLVLLTGLGACGGSGGSAPQTPSAVATPAPQALTAGTTVSIVSGEDYAPVMGARVVVSAREYVSNESGQIVLAEDAPYGSFVDVVASGFLDRQTEVPRSGATRIVLWPRETASGMTEAFTAQIVYTYGWSDEPEHGTSPLERLRKGVLRPYVWVSEGILQDPAAGRAHEEAVAEINAALEGRAVYVLTPTEGSGVGFQVRVEPGLDACAGGALGFFRSHSNSLGEITGGEIVYCSVQDARSVATVTHELAHSVGLQHSYRTDEVMNRYALRYSRERFSEREALAMRLLFERPAGNLFPDNDRSTTATASSGGTRTTICY